MSSDSDGSDEDYQLSGGEDSGDDDQPQNQHRVSSSELDNLALRGDGWGDHFQPAYDGESNVWIHSYGYV